MSEKIDAVAKAIRDECQRHGYLVSLPEGNRLWVILANAAIAAMREPKSTSAVNHMIDEIPK